MKRNFSYLFIFIYLFIFSQELRHKVQAKETIYGIAKKYNVTQEQIILSNPFLSERGLKVSDEIIISKKQTLINNLSKQTDKNVPKVVEKPTLKVPEKIQPKQQNKDVPVAIVDRMSNEFDFIEIQPQETIYNITKKFKINEETLKSLNPKINSEGLKVGDIIRIPKSKTENPKGHHLVKSKESVYKIARQYNVTTEDLYAVNPELQDGILKIGTYIKIPESSNIQKVEEGYFFHQIKENETVFNIINKYDTSLEVLLKENPQLQSGIRENMTIKIPVSKNAMNILKDNKTKKNISSNDVNLVMFLPFDSKNKTSIWSDVASDFYLGAKLAIDSISKKGKKINIRLVDSSDELSLSNFLIKYDFNQTDLIIGPLRKEYILLVANFLKNTKIPIIAPLSNSLELNTYKNIVSCEPLPLYMGTKIAQEISNIYTSQKIYLVYQSLDEKKEVEDIKTELIKNKNINVKNIIITRNVEDIKAQTDLISSNIQPIIPVLVSSNQVLANAFLTKIASFTPESIRPFSTYFHSNYEKNTYKTFLRKSKFVYTIERKIDFNGNEEQITLDKFKNKYCKQADKYSIVGFDVTYDILSRYSSNNLNLEDVTTQLGGKFEFIKKDEQGAYFNKGFRLVRMKE